MQATITLRRRYFAALAVVGLVVIGVAAAATVRSMQTAAPVASGVTPLAAPRTAADDAGTWRDALMARSAALNHRYGLSSNTQAPARTSADAWLTALMTRSAALNRKYGIASPRCAVTCEVQHDV